ncbi:MAG: transcriptional regulator [Alphaproteobacteria bacterium]|nr:MAG: transcriptional regulator [Alphaproteobacteria bacterium]
MHRNDQSSAAKTEVTLADDTKMSNADYATALTVAWLSNTNTRAAAADVPTFLQSMFHALTQLGTSNAAVASAEPTVEHTPKVSVRKSLASPDHIISMIDGKPYRTLKRHLAVQGLTPAEYRERYGLKADYPMIAPSYAATRSEIAKKLGLGRKSKADAPPTAEEPARKPRKAKAA